MQFMGKDCKNEIIPKFKHAHAQHHDICENCVIILNKSNKLMVVEIGSVKAKMIQF